MSRRQESPAKARADRLRRWRTWRARKDLEALLALPEGRRYLQHLIKATGRDDPIAAGNVAAMQIGVALNNFGLSVIRDVQLVNAALPRQMEAEYEALAPDIEDELTEMPRPDEEDPYAGT